MTRELIEFQFKILKLQIDFLFAAHGIKEKVELPDLELVPYAVVNFEKLNGIAESMYRNALNKIEESSNDTR